MYLVKMDLQDLAVILVLQEVVEVQVLAVHQEPAELMELQEQQDLVVTDQLLNLVMLVLLGSL